MLGSNLNQIVALRSASKLPQALRSPVYLTYFSPVIFRDCIRFLFTSTLEFFFIHRQLYLSQTLQFSNPFSSNLFPTYPSFFSLFLLLSFKLFLFPFFFILSFFLSSIVSVPAFSFSNFSMPFLLCVPPFQRTEATSVF